MISATFTPIIAGVRSRIGLWFLVALAVLMASQSYAAEVPLLTMVNHPVADAMIRGIERTLKKAGHTVKVYNPSGDQAMMQQMAKQIAGGNQKLAVSILTPPTNALKGALRGRGVQVYTGVIDRSLVGDSGQNSSLVGVPTAMNYRGTIELIRACMPEAKKIGYIMATSEPNAVFGEQRFRAAAESMGFKMITVSIAGMPEVRQAAVQAASRADVLLIGTGNTVISAAGTIIEAGNAARKPVFAGDEGSIMRGAVAGWTTDYEAAGEATGSVVVRLLTGVPVDRLAHQEFTSSRLIVNEKAFRRYWAKIPRAVTGKAEVVKEPRL